jgi:cystathionine beta-lyase/cystathionine gamma-synthase
VDGTDAENYRKAIRPDHRFFITESPNSLTFELQDLAAVAAIAKEHGILTLCDNSFNSPLFQNPIDLGIDLVAHRHEVPQRPQRRGLRAYWREQAAHIRQVMSREFMTLGACPSPHDAWLLMRGLRTLELRVNRSADNAERVALTSRRIPR